MPKRLGFALLTGMILTIVFSTGIMAGASPREVQSKQGEVASAEDRLAGIRQEAGASYEAYNSALFQLNQLDGKISSAEEDLAASETRMNEAKDDLDQRASQVYRSGNVGFVDVLVGADSFTEFASRMNIWMRLLGEEQAKFAEMREATNEYETQKSNLEDKRTERVSALESASEQRDAAAAAETEAQSYFDSLNGELQAAIEDEQARQAAAAQEAADQVAAAEASRLQDLQDQIESQALAEAQQRAEELAARQAEADEAAAEAERQAELAAEQNADEAAERQAEAEAAREAAEQAAIEQAAAEQAAAEQAAAEQAAAAQAAQEQAAADQAAAEQAAVDQAAADQAAADQAAAAEQAATEQAAADQAAAEQAAADQAAAAAADQAAADQAAVETNTQVASEVTPPAVPAEEEYANDGGTSADPGGGTTTPPATGGGGSGSVVDAARAQMGVPYVYGGADPSGFDCSGLVMYVMSQFGVSLPHNAASQYGYGSPGSGAAGDVVFWDAGGGISHNGIATGGGTVIHAPYPGTVVREEGIWDGGAGGSLVGYKTMV